MLDVVAHVWLQLYLGVFATKGEAIQAYDDALCREAVKQRSSVLRMPKKR